jgi:hypothetical protein
MLVRMASAARDVGRPLRPRLPEGTTEAMPDKGVQRRVAIMQPYVFPYIGYFQLMAQADVFVSHDDVNYIKGGWINRNRIADQGQVKWLTLPVRHAPHTLPINHRHYELDHKTLRYILRRLEAMYRRATHFAATIDLVETILRHEDSTVSAFNENALALIADRIGIATPILVSSRLTKDDTLRGQGRVIDICQRLGATEYVNPIGGRYLYDRARFLDSGLNLAFLIPGPRIYPIAGLVESEHLSIIDVLMTCSPSEIQAMLSQFSITTDPEEWVDRP